MAANAFYNWELKFIPDSKSRPLSQVNMNILGISAQGKQAAELF
jgi:hypothetical protein